MPLINVIRGERIPTAPFNIRMPFYKPPMWLVVTWWLLTKAFKTTVWACRYWYITAPLVILAWIYVQFGWLGLLLVPTGLVALIWVWRRKHWPSFARYLFAPVLSKYRGLVYRRHWHAIMATTQLAITFDGTTVLPELRSVTVSPSGDDRLVVRMVTGQIPSDYIRVAERLARSFHARSVAVSDSPNPDLIVLTARRVDHLATVVPPLPVPAVPDLSALPVGRDEDGNTYSLRVRGTHILVVGATEAGKASGAWALIRSVASGVRDGTVQIWALDPKGGMELGAGEPMFARFAYTDYAAMTKLLEEAADVAEQRSQQLRGKTRQHVPTPDDPAYLLIVDELATLVAYQSDRQLKDRIKNALGRILTKGRAVSVHVVALVQDARKEIVPFRNLFPTRVGLRMVEEEEIKMTLGDGARERGAYCDRISENTPGIAYVLSPGKRNVQRIRFSYLTDDDIADMVTEYAPNAGRHAAHPATRLNGYVKAVRP